MPMHDWTKVYSGWYHDFHQVWSIEIRRALNNGLLPKGLFAVIEQKATLDSSNKPEFEPDILTLDVGTTGAMESAQGGAVVLERPKTTHSQRIETDTETYARKANRITVRRGLDEVIAAIEIVSPGNKHNKASIRQFISKSVKFIERGIHLLIIDPFPPTPRDPQGIHKAIWDQFCDSKYTLPRKKNRTLVSYACGEDLEAFIEPLAVGDTIPDMPLFLFPDKHILVPLEATYSSAWSDMIEPVKKALEGRTRKT